jgi:hypothetical protein
MLNSHVGLLSVVKPKKEVYPYDELTTKTRNIIATPSCGAKIGQLFHIPVFKDKPSFNLDDIVPIPFG